MNSRRLVGASRADAATPRPLLFALAAAIGLAAPAAGAPLVEPAAPAFGEFPAALRLAAPASRLDPLEAARRALQSGLSPASLIEPSEAVPPAPAPLPAVAPTPAAVEKALAALLAERDRANPIGAGDWRAARQAIQAFYAARDYASIWTDAGGLTARAEAVLARLARAGEDGLDLSGFALPASPLAGLAPERLAEAETTISAAIVAYAMQASGSRVDPSRISPLIGDRPEVADPGFALAALAGADDPDATLQGFNPQQKGYRDLRDQLSRARAETAAVDPRPAPRPPLSRAAIIPGGPSLGLGMVDARVPTVRARLGLDPNAPNADLYDLPIAAAVQAFQRAHGLPPNGALTPATAAALSGDVASVAEAAAPTPAAAPARRVAMILANMEMWRWEPRAMGDQRIEINIPDYSLRVMSGDDLIHRARVIVGKPDTPTPIFSNEMRYILVNPIWRVPDSIVRKELAPRLAQDPDYLARLGYQATRVGDRLVVNQPPGEGNALGRLIFMFPNPYAVYLHDTPARGLFAAPRRAFSHGCVRLEAPMRLAELVMGGAASGWTAARLQSLFGGAERTIPLPRAIPIHLEYFTEFVDESGALQDREDVYGIARRVAGTFARTSQD